MLRLFLPIELSFTRVIRSEDIFPSIQRFLGTVLFPLGSFQITLTILLLSVWALGSMYLLLHLFRRIWQDKLTIASIYSAEDVRAAQILDEIVLRTKPGQAYLLIVSPEVAVPEVMGLITPVILLPQSTEEYSEELLRFILTHEWNHFLNNDQWIKLWVELLSCLLWWNPTVIILRKYLTQVLEIRCDLRVTDGIQEREKVEYMSAIVRSIGATFTSTQKTGQITGLCLAPPDTNQGAIVQRFHLIAWYQRGKRKLPTSVFVAAVLTIFLLSYSVVVQPYSRPPIADAPATFELVPENNYIIAHSDGTFSLVLENDTRLSLQKDMLQNPPFSLLDTILLSFVITQHSIEMKS